MGGGSRFDVATSSSYAQRHSGTVLAKCWSRCADARWSPDGGSVLFGDDRNAQIRTILVDIQTNKQRVIATGGDANWSPDGRLIAFGHDGTIWVMRADGSGKRRLAKGFHPVWSPDGKALAFTRTTKDSAASIYTVAINGTAAPRLVTSHASVGFVTWGHG